MPAPKNQAERLKLIKETDLGPITQALRLLPIALDSPRARAQMLKIGLQEGRLFYRDQIDKGGKNTVLGPALSVYQFERGGVRGVLTHPATKKMALEVCKARGVTPTTQEVWRAMATDDVLAAAMCRLNLYWHSKPLPDMHSQWDSWQYYIDCWRPGKPHPETWPEFHHEVVAYLTGKA